MNLESLRLIDQAIDAAGGVWPSNVSRCRVQKTIIDRTEFEARKAERQNKPSWGEHDYKFIHQGKNGHWYGSLKDNPSSLPDIITDGCWHYIETASARRGEVFGDYRNTLEQRPNQIHPTGDLGRSSGTVGANHIAESDEKSALNFDLEMDIAKTSPALALHLAKEKLEAYQDSRAKSDNPADWYDYESQRALRLPPVGLKVSYFDNSAFVSAGSDRNWKDGDELDVLAHVIVNGNKVCVVFNIRHETAQCLVYECIRPLDWDRLSPNPEPESSPELRFHLSNAFNELQASARLLPDSDPRRAQLVALASGVSGVREVA